MKPMIVVIALLLGMQGPMVFAQEDDCADECYPFKLCDGGPPVEAVCAKNPWTVSKGGQLLVPYRPPAIPIYLCEYVDQLEFKQGDAVVDFVVKGQDGQNHVVYDVESQVNDYIAAMQAWNTICPPRGGNPSCCINIKYSFDPQDFREEKEEGSDVFNIAGTMKTEKDFLNCQPKCEPQPTIYVNMTNQWLFANENAPPGIPWESFKRMFYTGTEPPSSVVARGRLEMISLRELITHELGHYYGLAHPGDAAEATEECAHKCVKDPFAEGAMVGWKANIKARKPSKKEECAFKKINCPNEVLDAEMPVAVEFASFELYPNVITNSQDIVIAKIETAQYNKVNVRVFDSNGKEMANVELEMQNIKPFYIPLKTDCYSSGTYFVKASLQTRDGGAQYELMAPFIVLR